MTLWKSSHGEQTLTQEEPDSRVRELRMNLPGSISVSNTHRNCVCSLESASQPWA